jgi:uncharacterized FlaG/YvyC family protein
MASEILPTTSATLLQIWTARVSEQGATDPAATQAKPAEAPTETRPTHRDNVVVEHDKLAGRYVQTFIDVETEKVVRQYPAEAQLAFARALGAYLKLLSEQEIRG